MYILIPISSFTKLFGIDNTFSLYNYKEVFRYANRVSPIITTTISIIATIIASVFSMIIAYLIVRKKIF